MIRRKISPRKDWAQRVEAQGFMYHSLECPYWEDGAYYEFTEAQALEIERVSNELHTKCLQAVDFVIANNLFSRLGINEGTKDLITESWERVEPGVYGRFDLVYGPDGNLKLLEYNAENPISLFEASAIQRKWAEDQFAGARQSNAICEQLRAAWQRLDLGNNLVHFSCDQFSAEDIGNLEYMRMEADAAGVATKLVYLQQMEYSHELGRFVDQDGIPIKIWFKLYPLSWLLNEPNGKFIPKAQLRIIEPPWKALLDHKGLLVVLSELFPNHPNILPCSFSPEKFSAGYVRKPIGGIQGSNVSVHLHGKVILKEGNFGEETAVYQPFIETTVQDGRHAVLGSWIIGDRYAGFGIRDSLGLITDTTCLFLPHVIT